MGVARIDQICSELREKGIPFSSTMISNGYLFDADMISRAKAEWKLTFVQITLDGTEETYNRVKAYVGVKDNPFRRVINNINELLRSDIDVSIRLNVDRYNADDQ